MKKQTILLIATSLSMMSFGAMGEKWLADFESPSWQVRHSGMRTLVMKAATAQQAEIDGMAMSIVELIESRTWEKDFEGSLHMAIKALGELKSDVAIPCLVKYLSFLPNSYDITELIPTEMYYPAAMALRNIGGEGVSTAMKNILLTHTTEDIEMRLALWILCEIDGRDKVADWMKRQQIPLRLSTGEGLSELLPSVGLILEPPSRRSEWNFGETDFTPHPDFQAFLRWLAKKYQEKGTDSADSSTERISSKNPTVEEPMETTERLIRENMGRIVKDTPELHSFLGELVWFGSHASTPDEAKLPFLMMSWADVPPEAFTIALKPFLKSRDPNMSAFVAKWLETVLPDQETVSKE